MKRLLPAFLLLAFLHTLSAQDVIHFADDFSDGPGDWIVNTYLCEGTTGENIGTYALKTGTYNGESIGDLSATLSIYTDLEYTLKFSQGDGQFGYSQAQFLVDNNAFISSLDGATFDLDSTIVSLDDEGRINYTSQLNITQELFDQWGQTLTGAGRPDFAKSGSTITLTSSDGLTVLSFEKTSDCGQAWIWHPNGEVGHGFRYPAGWFVSTETSATGVMQLNAQWLSSLGDVENLPDGPAPGIESELISPSIDLSDASGPIYLRFNQGLEYWPIGTENSPQDDLFNDVITSISYSVDGGQTWLDSINVNNRVKALDIVGLVPFSLIPIETRFIELPGVAGQSDVKVKFNWTGTFYFWTVDDITVQSAPENNVSLSEFIWYPADNYQTPASQLPLDTMDFFGFVSNNGSTIQTNVGLRAQVYDPDGALVFEDSLVIDELPAGYQDSLFFLPNAYIPEAVSNTEDEYLVFYTTFADSSDVNISDNLNFQYFRAHPDTYAKDNGGEIFPFGLADPGSDYRLGCFYELDPLAPNSVTATSAFYSVYAPEPLQNSAQILTNLYEVKDRVTSDFGNFNSQSTGEGSEEDDLELIAFGTGTMPSGEVFGDLDVGLGDIDGNPVKLKPGGRYFLTNEYTGIIRSALVHQIDRDIPYLGRIPMLFYLRGSGRWFFGVNFTANQEDLDSEVNVPVMHMSINVNTPADEVPLEAGALKIYPNPTVEQLSVDVDLDNRGPGLVIIANAEGKVMLWQRYESLQKETLNYNVTTYPAGNYFLYLGTEEGSKTLPFVVARK